MSCANLLCLFISVFSKDGKLQSSSSISAMIPATAKSNQNYTSGRTPKKANVSTSRAPLKSLSLGENDDYVFVS